MRERTEDLRDSVLVLESSPAYQEVKVWLGGGGSTSRRGTSRGWGQSMDDRDWHRKVEGISLGKREECKRHIIHIWMFSPRDGEGPAHSSYACPGTHLKTNGGHG